MSKKWLLLIACCMAGGFLSCNETVDWSDSVCNESERVCDQNSIKVCTNGQWTVETVCAGETPFCDPSTLTCTVQPAPSVCTDGQRKCADDLNSVLVCSANEWKEAESCSSGAKCNPNTIVCEGGTAVSCDNNGTPVAVGGTVCNADGTAVLVCNADGTLAATACNEGEKCAVEGDGTAACVTQAVVTCDYNGTTMNAGDTLCDAAQNMLVTCKDDATVETAVCENQICREGGTACVDYNVCKLESGEVAHLGKACQEGNVVVCNDGALTVETECTEGTVCSSESLRCEVPSASSCTVDGNTIENGASICSGLDLVTCGNGTTTKQTCTTEVANAEASCAESKCGFTCLEGFTLNAETGTCDAAGTVYTTISAIKADYDKLVNLETCATQAGSADAVVDVKGYVTAVKSSKSGSVSAFFMQGAGEDDAAILVYVNKAAVPEGLTVGDNISVKSNAVTNYGCQLQISYSGTDNSAMTIAKLEGTTEPAAVAADIAAIKDGGAKSALNAKLVKVSDVTFNVENSEISDGTNTIKISPYIYAKVAESMNWSTKNDVIGLVNYYNGDGLAPREDADIIVPKPVCDESTAGKIVCSYGMYEECVFFFGSGEWQEPKSCKNKFEFNEGVESYGCANTETCSIAKCIDGWALSADGTHCEQMLDGCLVNGVTYPSDSMLCISDTEVGSCNAGEVTSVLKCQDGKVCNPETINSTFACEEAAVVTSNVETFNGSALTKSYADGSFTSADIEGMKWDYTQARNTVDGEDDYSIDGKGMLFKASVGSLTGTAKNGVGTISVDVKKGFTGSGNRVVALTVGETECSKVTFDDAELHKLTCSDVNASGSTAITIKSTGSQAVIDNITWTDYAGTTPEPDPTSCTLDGVVYKNNEAFCKDGTTPVRCDAGTIVAYGTNPDVFKTCVEENPGDASKAFCYVNEQYGVRFPMCGACNNDSNCTGEGEKCVYGECKAACTTEGAKRCSADGFAVEKCTGGFWKADPCSSLRPYCVEGTSGSAKCEMCIEGATKCWTKKDGTVVYYSSCNLENHTWNPSSACPSDDENGIVACKDEFTCNAPSTFTCKDGFKKEGGKCVAAAEKCTADVCKDGMIQICGTDGKLAAATACTTDVANAAAVCADAVKCGFKCNTGYTEKDGACVKDAICTPGEVKCKSNNVQTCNAEGTAWTVTDDCVAAEMNCTDLTATPSCVDSCMDSAQDCMDNMPVVCNGDVWQQADAPCGEGQVCVVAGNTASCVAKCTADVCKDGKLQKCGSDGKLSKATACTTTVANAVGACSSASACGDFKCSEGYVKEGGKCVAAVTPKCEEGTMRCSGEVLEACTDGKWTTTTDCSTNKEGLIHCSEAKTTCVECNVSADCTDPSKPVCANNQCVVGEVAKCTPDSFKCSDNNIMMCNSTGDAYEVYETCSGSKSLCNAGKTEMEEPVCVECINHSDCDTASGLICSVDNTCQKGKITACTPDTLKCVDNNIMQCNKVGDAYEAAEVCDGATPVCSEESGEPKCVAESKPAPAITWCNFQHIDANGKDAYARVLVPEGADVTSTIYCTTDSSKNIKSWTAVETTKNDLCSGCDGKTEYMTTALPKDAGEYTCVAAMTVAGGKSYVCPAAGGNPDELTDATAFDPKYSKTYTVAGGSAMTQILAPETASAKFSAVDPSDKLESKHEGGYFNSYQWSSAENDLNTIYVKYDLSQPEVAELLKEKKTIAASFRLETNKNVKQAVIAFYNGDERLGDIHTVSVPSDVSEKDFMATLSSDISQLHIRIAGLSTSSSKAGLRIFPITVYAK